jgi:biotin carboxylase
MRTAIIVASCQSYRIADYLKAAAVLRLDPVRRVQVSFEDPAAAAAQITSRFPKASAVVAAEDEGVGVGAAAAAMLGLPHNPVAAVAATRNKLMMRRRFSAAGVAQPAFAEAPRGGLVEAATALGFPCVVKPMGLSASRGVIRLDGPRHGASTEERIRRILVQAGRDANEPLIVEEFVPGGEIVVEGVLENGEMKVLAVIDKPLPLDGPYFEETLFVSPSRLPATIQQDAIAEVAKATAALGLTMGPVHGEARVGDDGRVRVLEVAARTIGGLCGRSLTFGLLGESLEVLVLRSALGERLGDRTPARPATGVLMLPIPATGVLTSVEGVEAVRSAPGIDAVEMTVPIGREVVALPEGDRYLGFVFASGTTPQGVEATLQAAGRALTVTVDGEAVGVVGQA